MSANDPNRTSQTRLLDHLVRSGEDRRRNGEAKRPGAFMFTMYWNLVGCSIGRSPGFGQRNRPSDETDPGYLRLNEDPLKQPCHAWSPPTPRDIIDYAY